MNNLLETYLDDYLLYCTTQKRLDSKTLKAYRIDLHQFLISAKLDSFNELSAEPIEQYISQLHQSYKPKTVKRKIASLKAFCHYLECKNYIQINPFHRIQTKFREPFVLPKTIPLQTIEKLLCTIYNTKNTAKSSFQKKNAIRDAAVIELLFATGMRISELCSLRIKDVNLQTQSILIFGKGAKERIIQIPNPNTLSLLQEYQNNFYSQMKLCNHFFVNQNGTALSDQSIRRMISKYCIKASINQHITPHMFRHTFATGLLEADVDIRYIQDMLGHSSISITEIYTHVSMSKQREILQTKHPRLGLKIYEK